MQELDTRTAKYVESFSKLIQADTTTVDPFSKDLERFYQFHTLLKEVFPHIMPLCEHENIDGNILIRWPGRSSGKKPALFMYHHDVIPVDPAQWSHPPFGAEIADGKLWGRGTLDTKCGLWGVLQAAEELAEEGFVPDRDIYFVSTRNEESSGFGAEAIVKALNSRGIELDMTFDEGGFILYDPIGGTDGTFAIVAVSEKLPLCIKFSAKAAGGHAAMPVKNSPHVRISRFILDIEKHDPFPPVISDTTAEMLRRFGPYMKKFGTVASHPKLFAPVIKKLMPALSPMAGAMLKTTLAFTMSGASPVANALPTEAWVIGNMRVAPHQTPEECFAILDKVCQKYGIEMTRDYNAERSGAVTDYNGEAFRLTAAAVKHAYPEVDNTVPYLANTASDSSAYAKYCKQCIRFNPFIISKQQMGTIHGIDENIDLSTLVPGVEYFRYILKRL